MSLVRGSDYPIARRDYGLMPMTDRRMNAMVNPMRRQMDRFKNADHRLSDVTAPWGTNWDASADFDPDLDVYDQGDHFYIVCELPGTPKENISVEIKEPGALLIQGMTPRKPEMNRAWSPLSERFTGKFVRTVRLPVQMDFHKVKVTLNQGLLEITVPKSGGKSV